MNVGINYEICFWVKRGKRRKKVLLHLDRTNRPITVKHIAVAIGSTINKVSETLCDFRKRNIVELIDRHKQFDRRYKLTPLGEITAAWIKTR